MSQKASILAWLFVISSLWLSSTFAAQVTYSYAGNPLYAPTVGQNVGSISIEITFNDQPSDVYNPGYSNIQANWNGHAFVGNECSIVQLTFSSNGSVIQWSVHCEHANVGSFTAGIDSTWKPPYGGGGVDGADQAVYDFGAYGYTPGTWTSSSAVTPPPPPPPPTLDTTVSLTNSLQGEEVGLLVSGHAENGGDWLRHIIGPYSSPGTSPYDLGDVLTTNSTANSLFVFSDTHPPHLTPTVDWTSTQNVNVTLDPTTTVPVKFWFTGDTLLNRELERLSAIWMLGRAKTIWAAERSGIDFTLLPMDASSVPPLPVQSFTQKADCKMLKSLIDSNDLTVEPGALNVYLVEQFNPDTTNPGTEGNACGNPYANAGSGIAIVKSNNSDVGVLAHEIGHNFGLTHPCENEKVEGTNCPNQPYFDATNLMWWVNGNYEYLTEGQTFRANFSPNSILNGTVSVDGSQTIGGAIIDTSFNVNPTIPLLRTTSDNSPPITRVCARDSQPGDPTCPRLCKRIWSDGASPLAACNEP